MRAAKRVLAVCVMLLSAAVLVAALAGSIGVWVVREPVTACLTRSFDRVQGALDVAKRVLAEADTNLTKAVASVAAIKDGHARLGGAGAADKRLALRVMAATINTGLTPQVAEARQRLRAVAEVSVALNSLLGTLNEFPLVSIPGPDENRLNEVGGGLSRLAGSAEELSGMLKGPEPGADAVGPHVVNIEQVLEDVRARTADYQARLAEVKQKVDTLRSRTLAGIDPGTVIVSLALLWIAVSQVSLLAHAWAWLKKGTASRP